MCFSFFCGGGILKLFRRFPGLFFELGHLNTDALSACVLLFMFFVSCFSFHILKLRILSRSWDCETCHDTSVVASHVVHVVSFGILDVFQVSSLCLYAVDLFLIAVCFWGVFLNIVSKAVQSCNISQLFQPVTSFVSLVESVSAKTCTFHSFSKSQLSIEVTSNDGHVIITMRHVFLHCFVHLVNVMVRIFRVVKYTPHQFDVLSVDQDRGSDGTLVDVFGVDDSLPPPFVQHYPDSVFDVEFSRSHENVFMTCLPYCLHISLKKKLRPICSLPARLPFLRFFSLECIDLIFCCSIMNVTSLFICVIIFFSSWKQKHTSLHPFAILFMSLCASFCSVCCFRFHFPRAFLCYCCRHCFPSQFFSDTAERLHQWCDAWVVLLLFLSSLPSFLFHFHSCLYFSHACWEVSVNIFWACLCRLLRWCFCWFVGFLVLLFVFWLLIVHPSSLRFIPFSRLLTVVAMSFFWLPFLHLFFDFCFYVLVFDIFQVSTLYWLHTTIWPLTDTYFIVRFVVFDSSGTLCFMWIQYLTYPIPVLWNLFFCVHLSRYLYLFSSSILFSTYSLNWWTCFFLCHS